MNIALVDIYLLELLQQIYQALKFSCRKYFWNCESGSNPILSPPEKDWG